jgi:hypothetical protein
MRTPPLKDDPAHWRRRAEEARRLARELSDPTAKATMLEIAQSYEQLAFLAEKRLGSKADDP